MPSNITDLPTSIMPVTHFFTYDRGEFIAYNFLHAMLDAIYMVEADLRNPSLTTTTTTTTTNNNNTTTTTNNNNNTPTPNTLLDAAQRYQNALSQLQDFPLPAPTHCGLECTTRPMCYTGLRRF